MRPAQNLSFLSNLEDFHGHLILWNVYTTTSIQVPCKLYVHFDFFYFVLKGKDDNG